LVDRRREAAAIVQVLGPRACAKSVFVSNAGG